MTTTKAKPRSVIRFDADAARAHRETMRAERYAMKFDAAEYDGTPAPPDFTSAFTITLGCKGDYEISVKWEPTQDTDKWPGGWRPVSAFQRPSKPGS
jgi:hypothetical protein